jgi:hypothetical protein
MIYYANGGFNWHDLYYMPVKLREFYFRELVNAKEEENESYDKALNKNKKASPSQTTRRR